MFKSKLPNTNFFDIASDLPTAFVIRKWADNDNKIKILLRNFINQKAENALKEIKIFLPTFYGSNKNYLYKSTFTEEDFLYMKNYLDLDLIYQILLSEYGILESKIKSDSYGEELEDKDIIALFQKYYSDNNQISSSLQIQE